MSDHDVLVPDPVVAKEFGVCGQTTKRWDKDPRMVDLGWPLPTKIRGRIFRPRRGIEAFKIAAARATRKAS